MYNDASLALIPSAVGDGVVYNARPVEVLGAELVTSGDFATDSDWTKDTGWTISGGKAIYTGTANASLNQSNALISGKFYKLQYEVISSSLDGNFKISGVTESAQSPLSQSVGTHTVYFTADGSAPTNIALRVVFNTTGTLEIDNVSVTEVLTSAQDFDFTRASEATRVLSGGRIEKVRTNSLLQSNDFDTTWALTGVTITGGQADKDGGTDAWLLEASSSGGGKKIVQTVSLSSVNAYSLYAKAGNVNYLALEVSGTTYSYVNLTDGTLGASGGAGLVDFNTTNVGGGWWRITMTTTSVTRVTIFIAGSSSATTVNTGDNILIQNAQLEQGLAATEYIATTSTSVSVGSVNDMPRLDWSGGCPSLILEPSRTNLWPSEYITSWLSSGATVDYNATTSPDSYLNAMRLNSTTSQSRIQLNNGTITGGYTGSVYVKSAGDYATLRLRLNTTGEQLQFNINTDGTVTRLTGDADYTITDAGNGWHRVTALFTAVGDSNNYFQIYADSSNGGSSVYIYGIQFELGNYSTSLIPTYGTAATRVADACYKTGITSLIGQTEGTFYWEGSLEENPSGTNMQFALSDGTTSQQIKFVISSSSAYVAAEVKNGGVQQFYNNHNIDAKTNRKYAIAYNANDFAFYIDGTQIATDTSGSVPACSNLSFDSGVSANGIHGNFKSVILFPTRLTSTELEKLTTL